MGAPPSSLLKHAPFPSTPNKFTGKDNLHTTAVRVEIPLRELMGIPSHAEERRTKAVGVGTGRPGAALLWLTTTTTTTTIT